jgi:hypothetical protein
VKYGRANGKNTFRHLAHTGDVVPVVELIEQSNREAELRAEACSITKTQVLDVRPLLQLNARRLA